VPAATIPPGAALLLDFDGTVNDSRPALREAGRRAGLAVLGRPIAPERVLRDISRGIGPGMRAICPSRAEPLAAAFREHLEALAGPMARPYPGIRDVVARVSDAGRPIAIVTSTTRACLDAVEGEAGIAGLVDVVVCEDDGLPLKPDPAPVRAALGRLRVPAGRAVMVGDSPWDVLAARAAGVASIAATWGLGPRARLVDAGPDALADSPGDLPELLGLS
jgi:pyrophosphatase PpaX